MTTRTPSLSAEDLARHEAMIASLIAPEAEQAQHVTEVSNEMAPVLSHTELSPVVSTSDSWYRAAIAAVRETIVAPVARVATIAVLGVSALMLAGCAPQVEAVPDTSNNYTPPPKPPTPKPSASESTTAKPETQAPNTNLGKYELDGSITDPNKLVQAAWGTGGVLQQYFNAAQADAPTIRAEGAKQPIESIPAFVQSKSAEAAAKHTAEFIEDLFIEGWENVPGLVAAHKYWSEDAEPVFAHLQALTLPDENKLDDTIFTVRLTATDVVVNSQSDTEIVVTTRATLYGNDQENRVGEQLTNGEIVGGDNKAAVEMLTFTKVGNTWKLSNHSVIG